jgi:putative Holliday junction resolvase
MAGEASSPPLPAEGRLIAVDLGERRIGVAVCDPQQVVAQPLTTLTRRPGRRFPLKQLRTYIQEYDVVGFVIGLPLSPEGLELEGARAARHVALLIREKTGRPVEFWDERMTTSRALSAIRELGGGIRGRKGEVDQLAATVLLQTFLDSRK